MARVSSDTQGKIVRFAANALEDAIFNVQPHPDAVESLEFDEVTNPSIVDAIRTDTNSHTLIAGVLRRNGVLVTLAPNAQETTDGKRLLALLELLNSKASAQDELDLQDLSTFVNRLAPAAGNLSAAEIKRMDRVHWIVLRAILQLLKDRFRP